MEENGTIDADKKVIRIAKDAENPLVQVLGHEVAHGVRRIKRIFTSDAEAFGGINAIRSDEYGAAENAVFIDIGGYEGCIFEINTD